jgi:hypothetical protein
MSSGQDHLRHFHVDHPAHAKSWNTHACEAAHGTRTLFGTISTFAGWQWNVFRAYSGSCLVTLFGYGALGPVQRSNAPATSAFASLAKPYLVQGTRPYGIHVIRIDLFNH